MASHLVLKLRDDDPWIVAKKAFDIVAAYLQPDSSASATETAACLDALTPTKRQLCEGEESEQPGSFLLEFWETFVVIVRQVPHDHPSQKRLVELVKELDRLAATSAESVWAHLQRLDNVLADNWNVPSEQEDSFEPFKEWVNLNSFVSRLYGAGLIKWYRFAIWTIRDSLENSQVPAADLLESRVAAAAQWIENSASKLFKTLRDTEPSEGDRRAFKSPLFDEEKVLSLDRWAFWRSKFQELAELEVSQVVKTEAIRAAQVMDQVESI
ncbi:hypothetical protein AOQ84DRAFT_387930 [Glonium stellatum]|uniref:Uncharacterized protein n=1 Tax=Glonium stellatum TaxID=574774 RepID=A0A8E2JUB4_9PEZI|nr:hypothetical protein AOQ84DRAFT_387930 [Glonium stellatum]